MKRIYSLLIYIVFINIFPALATTYTWTGNTSTAWNTTSNWSPSGTPTTGDFVHIYSGTYNPQLPGNLTLNGIYMHSGTLNLNGDTLLLNSGTSTFSGGTVTNGLLQLRGTEMTFNSTTFNAPIDAVVDRINLNGSTFNNYCYFETITNVPGTGSGGAVFNDSVYLYHNYTGSGIWVMNNSTGLRFNGKVTIHNKSTKEITFAGAGINVFNGDIVLINTGAGGIMLGNDTLTSGHTISIGSGGFSAGDFNATNFYQDGNTAISLTFTGSALPSITGATFGGNFSITSNVLLFKNCTFNGTASFTATGSGSSSWYGGNTFYGNATFTNNASAGNLRLDTDTSNTYYADATFGGSRELRVCYGGDVSSFYGNITTASNTTFNAGTGTLCLAGSGNQTLSFGGSNFVKNLMLNKSGGSATLATALAVSGTITFVKGTLTTTSSNLLTINSGGSVSGASDSSFIDGPVKKIGNAAFVFPTGKGNSYRAIEISAPSNTTDAFTGEYFNTGQVLGNNKDTTIKQLNNCDYWELSRNVGSSNITVTLFWNKQTCLITSLSSMRVCNWNGTIWKDKGNAGYTGSAMAGSITASLNNNTYSYFTLGNNTITYTGLPAFDIVKGFALLSGGNIVLNTSLYAFGKTGSMGTTSNLLMASDSIIQNGQNPLDTAIIEVANAIAYINGLSAASISDSIYDQILTPGVYEFENDAYLGGKIHFTGDTNAVYIFKAKGNLTITPQTYFETDSVKLSRIIWACNKNFLSDTMTNFRGIVLAKGNINFKTDNFGYSMSATLSDIDLFHNSNANRFPYSRSIFELENLNLNLLPCNTSIYPCKNLLPNGSFEDGPIPQTGGQFVTNVNCWSIGIRGAYDITGTIFCRQSNGLTPDIYDQFALCTSGCGLNCSNTSGAFPDVRIPTNTYTTNTFCHSSNNYRYMALSMDEAANTTLISALDHATYLLSYWVKPSDCFTMSNINNYRLCVNIFNFGSPAKQYNIASHNFAGLPANDWTRLYECVDLTNTSYDLAGIDRLGFALQSSSLPDDKMFFDDFYLIKVADAGPDVVACSTATIGSSCQFDPAIFEVTFNWTGPGGFSSTDANPVVTTSGTYTLEVTIFDPITHLYICDGMDEVNVSLTGTGLSVSITSSAIVCNGQSNGSLTALPSGATTYQWSNSATTQTITNLNAGTYTVTVTQNGCTGSTSATLTNPPVLTVSVTKTNVSCQGGNNGTATATPSGGVSPYTFQWSSGGATTSQTNTGLSTGTYTVTVTDVNGCTTATNVTIGYSNSLPPAPFITATSGSAAACVSTNSYSVTNILSGATYTWTANPITGASSGSGSTASNLDWDDFVGGTINFTVNNGTCTNTSSYIIYPCCSTAYMVTDISVTDIINNNGNYSGIYYNNGFNIGFYGGNLAINGTLTVDQYFEFSNMNIFLGPQAKIIVQNGSELSIMKSNLHGCGDYMWDGIFASGSGNQISIGASSMEDAENGIMATNNAVVFASTNFFNRNYKTISIENNSGTSLSLIKKCSFTSLDISGNPVSNLLPPHFNQRSFYGVGLKSVDDITVGSSLSNSANTFNNLDNGILSYNSSANVIQCQFENITTNSGSQQGTFTGFPQPPSGLGIGAVGLGATRTINVGTISPGSSSALTVCTFDNSTNGIFLLGNISSTIEGNTFTDINVGTSPAWMNNYTGQSAIGTLGGNNLSLVIEKNLFQDFVNGINIRNKRSSNISITGNKFNKPGGGTTGEFGILVEKVQAGANNLNTISIDGNEMHDITHAGIILLREHGAQITHNIPINIVGPVSPWPYRVRGISLLNTSLCTVEGNRIEATNLNPPTNADDNRVFGIEVQSAMGGFSRVPNDITSNHIIHTGRGIASLLNYTPQTLQCNNLDENYTGVWLFSSNIGDQLNGGTDQNNSWTLLGGAAAARGIVGSTNIPPSVWYCPSCTSNPILTVLQMTNSGVTFADNINSFNCSPAPLRQSQSWLVDVAYEQNYGDSLSNDEKYLAKKQVYYLLSADDSLMLQGTAEDTVLSRWYDSTAVYNIGLFKTVSDSADANPEYALTLNESIISENHAEENEKAVNAIYLVTWALDTFDFSIEQYEILYAIANETPLTGGTGVYAARVMLGLHIDDDYESIGSRMANPDKTNQSAAVADNKIKLMPNPATNETLYLNHLLKSESGVVTVYTKMGVAVESFLIHEGDNKITIDLQKLAQGIYFVETKVNDKTRDVRKLAVIK